MKRQPRRLPHVLGQIARWLPIVGATILAAPAQSADFPRNLASDAQAEASSEFSDLYRAGFAIDGKVPPAGSQGQDQGAAWCVHRPTSGDRGEFTLRWQTPVRLGQLVYWGRTGWFMTECWRDYRVFVDDAVKPVMRGRLEMVHGPQRITFLQPVEARSVRLEFVNSYGGPNPGASEIQAFEQPLGDRQLAALAAACGASSPAVWAGQPDPAALAELIDDLQQRHAGGYPGAADCQARLVDLTRRWDAATEDARDSLGEQFEQLERDVLLGDVDRLLAIRRREIAASHVYTYHYEGFSPGGGLYVVDPRQPDAEPLELVATAEGQILDCDLSYDGRTVLFSWRRKESEGYHLWTVGVDGSNLTRLTDGVWHDYNGCWLPDGDIAFLSTRAPQFAYCWHAPVGILHRMSPDGSRLVKLSANYLNDFTPAVLDDGRILYTRWEYVDRPAIPIQSLWTLNPDGTGLAGFFGNRVISPGTFMEARSVPGTSKIVCTMTGHNGPTRGAIGLLDRSRGVNAQAAIDNITPDVPVPNVDQGNGNTEGTKLYSCPWPLDDRRFLVSCRGPVLVRTYSGRCAALAIAAPQDGMQWFSARPVAPRTRPPVTTSGQAVDLDGKEEGYATLFLQDVYNGLAPQVERGEVAAIRVVREMQKSVRIDPSLRAFGFQFPVISCGATYAGKMVLGDVPVGADGSASFRVPAGIPIYFIALDRQGRAVQRMRSFTHLMPGEVQGCVGCHEHRLQTARASLVSAASRRPVDLVPPEWGVGGFDYSRIVQPVLDKHCTECHNALDAPKGIDLGGSKTDFFNVSYDVLARQNQGQRGSLFVNWIPTYNGQEWNILEIAPKSWGSHQSPLAEVLLSGHLDEDGKPRIELDDAERRRILSWIDLNVPYYGSSETAYPEAVGCRKIYPADLDAVLAEVAARRCAGCHEGGKIPRGEWTRITEPELNQFLLAPLAQSAGGRQRCGTAVFADTGDPDYRKILATFEPTTKMLQERPRMDMPGGKPAPDVCRVCQ
ncbi:MAG: HzsA-related protein [Thermoguttaceae bacterium]